MEFLDVTHMDFLVMAHMDFLVVTHKNNPQDPWQLLGTHLKSEWKYFRKYLNYYYEKNSWKNIISCLYE